MRPDRPLPRRPFLASAATAISFVPLAGCASGGDGDASAWVDVDEISLEGRSTGWAGVEPSAIDGVTNPTFYLVEGREYTVTWENMDGLPHNFVLVTEDEESVTGTELMGEQGETQTHTFDATTEIAEYICGPHRNQMRGTVEFFDPAELDGDD